jgi:hypothetical protein
MQYDAIGLHIGGQILTVTYLCLLTASIFTSPLACVRGRRITAVYSKNWNRLLS